MQFNSPLSEEKARTLIQLLELNSSDHVLDAGCGTGEFLLKLLSASGASGIGLDINSASLEEAKRRQKALGNKVQVEFHALDLRQVSLEDSDFSAAVCIGSTHAFADGDKAWTTALQTLRSVVRPGGLLLLGEGYWKQPPAKEYRELLGEPVGIYHDHIGNIHAAEALGLIPLYATVSNEEEWDHFEWSHRRKIELLAQEHADDPVWQKRLEQSRRWRDGYLRWGRSTMGFGFYLFQVPR